MIIELDKAKASDLEYGPDFNVDGEMKMGNEPCGRW